MQWQWIKKMQTYFLWEVTGFYSSSQTTFTQSKNIFQVLEERFYAELGCAFSATHLPNYFTLPSPLSHHIKWTSIPYLYINHFETLYLYTVWVQEMYGTTLKLNYRGKEIKFFILFLVWRQYYFLWNVFSLHTSTPHFIFCSVQIFCSTHSFSGAGHAEDCVPQKPENCRTQDRSWWKPLRIRC